MQKVNQQIFKKKYQMYDTETFDDMCKRVAYNDEQYELMTQMLFMPAGRQLIARENKIKKTLFNCYALGYKNDSLEAISKFEARSDLVSSRGGGIGTNFSILRPADTERCHYKDSVSSGAVSFMKRFAYMQSVITQGGSRRGALIGILDMWHPSIIDFLNVKNDLGEINNMNISPLVSDEFMIALKNEDDWNLIFPDIDKISKDIYDAEWNGFIEDWIAKGYPVKIHRTIKARKLWDIIISNAWATGEPGILFKDNINKHLNYKNDAKINTVNPCVTGDTKLTTNFGILTIKDCIGKFDNDEEILVLSYNEKTKKNEFKKIINGMLTRKNTNIIKIKFNNGKSIRLTPDHKIYTKYRNYIESSKLETTDVFLDDKIKECLLENITILNNKEDVYDITVKDNCNFFANNILIHNCGEQTLPVGDDGGGTSCNLGSINFLQIYDDTKPDYINWSKFDLAIKVGVEFLDMSIDAEKYFDEQIEKNQKYYRQIGLGIMGYADLLIKLGITYGTQEAISFTDKIMKFMLDKSYYYSAMLAKKLGKAPVYNVTKLHEHYLNLCSKETQLVVRQYGLRNSNVLSIAPTGSIAMLCNVNGGIEPYFRFEYERNDILGKRIIKVGIINEAKNKKCLVSSQDINPERHIKTQGVFQKYVDSSISKTINLPSDASLQDVQNVFCNAYLSELKGVTVYRDKCREGVLTEIAVAKNSDKLPSENKQLYDFYRKNGKNVVTNGIKPPNKSFLKKRKVSDGKKYYFFIGYLTKKFEIPYEFFILTNSHEKTAIVDELIDDISQLLENNNVDKILIERVKSKIEKQSNVDKIARLISMALRHNIDLRQLCNLLEKYTKHISSLIYWIRKTLMELIKDGTKTQNICPHCGSDLIYINGCIECIDRINCGYSKC